MRALGLDTETTDLIRSKFRPLKDQPHVTEFFGLSLELKDDGSWEEVGSYGSLFNPGIALTPEITKITGLRDEDLKDAPRFETKAREIVDLIGRHDIVFAHNLGFDSAILDIEMQRATEKIDWSKVRRICTVEATEHLKHRRLKLMELHELLFGEGFPNAHRAENDVRPMARCFKELWAKGIFG